MFKTIPKQRLLLYMLVIGLLPVLWSLFYFVSTTNALAQVNTTTEQLTETALIQEKKQASNMAVRSHFKDADHFYIDKYLETLVFLEPEIEGLQKILSNKNIAEDENAKKRLEFLTSPANSLAFSEGVVQSAPFFQETTETLVHPVEINGNDLKKILARIEGVEFDSIQAGPNRPQLIILDFKLDKKAIRERNEVFNLNLKLLKREYQ